MKTFLQILLFFLLITQISFPQLEFLNKQTFQRSIFNETSTALNTYIDSLMLDSIITEYRASDLIPGIATLIIKDDKIIWNKNYGYRNLEQQLPVEDSTLFLMASISKTFLATAIMQLWEKGLIDLEGDINNYLPNGFNISNPYHPSEKITVKSLMTHSSSLIDNWAILDKLNFCGDSPIRIDSFLINYFTPNKPYYDISNFASYDVGQGWWYSNSASLLLALMVEHISGKSFDKLTKDSIFTPLSMLSTSWFLKDLDTNKIATPYENNSPVCHIGMPFYPVAQLRTNKFELANFIKTYINGGTLGSSKILANSTIDLMLSDQLGLLTFYGENQGLIWFNAPPMSVNTWGHTGHYSGYSTAMFLNREEKWGIILFQNNDIEDQKYWSTIYSMGKYAHLYGNIFVKSFQLNNSFARKNLDSLLFIAQFSNTFNHQFTAYLIFNSLDKSTIDSVLLSDNGTGGDTYSNDGIYSAYIPIQSTENFFEIGVSTIDQQTGSYYFTDKLSQFTTIPLVIDSTQFDIYTNHRYTFKPFLKNMSTTHTITNIVVKLTSKDPWVTLITPDYRTCINLTPGQMAGISLPFLVSYDTLTFKKTFNLTFSISSSDFSSWIIDTTISVVTDIKDKLNALPTEFSLAQNYPNPFNPNTTIKYSIPELSKVKLVLYNLLGEKVKTLINEEKSAGNYEAEFKAENIPSGVYFYQILVSALRSKDGKAGDFVQTKKMIFLK